MRMLAKRCEQQVTSQRRTILKRLLMGCHPKDGQALGGDIAPLQSGGLCQFLDTQLGWMRLD